jgi:uncharacterized membrane protein YgaE (UPF0421/DUF939 family)
VTSIVRKQVYTSAREEELISVINEQSLTIKELMKECQDFRDKITKYDTINKQFITTKLLLKEKDKVISSL